ncbi:MAG: 2,6-beta-D-fructofuranosidase [Prevotella sp.]|jgi:hypothetical protein
MKPIHRIFLYAAPLILPTQLWAQDIIQKDSVVNTKEEKNRNVMLNATATDQPRQINVGLPGTRSATIFEDGIPVSYFFWPDMPYYSWFGGATYDKTSVMSLSEGAIQYGEVSYVVDSHNRYSTEKFQGLAQYQFNHFGRQSLDMALTGPIGHGWGYTISSHQVWDPGTYKLQAANLQNRTQSYKIGIDKSFAGGRGKVSLLYQYTRYTNTSSDYAPFIFVGDGSVKKYNGFKMGTDSYYANEMSSFPYMDIITGEIKTTSWKDAGTTDNNTIRFNLDYTFDNGNKLSVASKFKHANVKSATTMMTNVIDNTGGYYYSDGTVYTGDKIQNFNLSYSPNKDNEWLTTLTYTGNTGNHSWRVGLNYWYQRSYSHEMSTSFLQEAAESPAELYVKNDDGTLERGLMYNPQAGYYSGHDNTLAVFASDDWQINKRLWMSLGVRLAYQAYGAMTANNIGESTVNTRHDGWYLNDGTHVRTHITGDWINPSAAYNVRYTIAKGFGVMGEYVYTRQRSNLEDYASENFPNEAAMNTHMARGGIFWNNSWIQLVSQISFINKDNNKRRSTFYHIMTKDAIDGSGLKAGEEDSRGIQMAYGIQTLGWTTDIVLTPFKGFSFHGSFTLQDPQYKDFDLRATFSDGVTDGMDVSGHTVTAMSKVLIELDPSYTIDRWRFNLNFRYFSKQYINKTNTLYFNGWWESFGSVNYHLNDNVDLGMNITNLFNQLGAKGEIGAADLVTDTTPYQNYVMAGSYIRPFEVAFSATIKF